MTKPSFTPFFKDKTVTLMGLGLLGRGVGDAAFLARHCKKLYVTDAKSADELRVSVDALKIHTNIEFVLGGHDNRIFENVDFVVKGAGVRLDNPYIAHARAHNIPVYMSTALFVHLSGLKSIGVTGTRGKTSTTCMIADILEQAGEKVLRGGNLRGVSTLALLPEASQFDVAVLELDSWQMQGFDSLGISPNISVFTNFYPDHMNYYDGDMARYLHDKSAIFRHQKAGDAFITTREVADILAARAKPSPLMGEGWVGVKPPQATQSLIAPPLPATYALKIPGAHNLANAALAKAAARAYGIDDAQIDKTLHAFTGVEGRLQWVGNWQGRDFYNDSNATTQDATLAALAAFPANSIVLIFGGADKFLPIDTMLDFISAHHIRAVLIKGTGSDRVLAKHPNLPTVASMSEAVRIACELSKPQDNIILSPAFASFGVFKNEYDRSDQFMSEVQKRLGPN